MVQANEGCSLYFTKLKRFLFRDFLFIISCILSVACRPIVNGISRKENLLSTSSADRKRRPNLLRQPKTYAVNPILAASCSSRRSLRVALSFIELLSYNYFVYFCLCRAFVETSHRFARYKSAKRINSQTWLFKLSLAFFRSPSNSFSVKDFPCVLSFAVNAISVKVLCFRDPWSQSDFVKLTDVQPVKYFWSFSFYRAFTLTWVRKFIADIHVTFRHITFWCRPSSLCLCCLWIFIQS